MYIEKDCVFEHEGRKFESGGAVVADGFIVGYPEIRGEYDRTPHGVLKNWKGDQILGTLTITAKWRTPRSFVSDCMYQMEVRTPDGKVYTGRSSGNGMLYRGRVKR